MTRLLVSVRNAAEAALALRAGVAVIDVKEPRAGSLGAATPETIAEIAQAVCDRVPLSVACGELLDFRAPPRLPATLRYAKFGLAGCAAHADWTRRWRQALATLPPTAQPVAVAYADWRLCNAPAPDEVLHAAKAHGCAALLVDTYDKSRGGLFAHLSVAELRPLIAAAHEANLLAVLAGSLDRASLAAALALQPDLVAVRGAVCRAGREAEVDPALLAEVAALVTPFAAAADEAPSGGQTARPLRFAAESSPRAAPQRMLRPQPRR